MREMELLALLAISLMSVIGWVITTECLARWVDAKARFYFAPAVGMCACAIIAYVAVGTKQMWAIRAFTFVALVAFVIGIFKKQSGATTDTHAWRLLRFTLLALLCLYGMQISLFLLFRAIYPATHEVWNILNLSGVSPPDQMFAWHQAMFAALHRHYPQDPFYGEMDLYDRPHLGGYLTLFFFQLFHLPLKENHFIYPAVALRFYHCFWWLLNNLYLLGIAPLFQRLFGYRGAILAVASTAMSGFFFLCNVGGWMKFASAYPFLLAVFLFLEGRGPVLQAALCAASYYVHGSVLPFLAGFGMLQIFSSFYPIRSSLTRARDLISFALVGVALVGAWFVTVWWVGSKQPLLYYYLYGADLTQAQIEPAAEIVKAFYAKHSWSSLSLFPLHNLVQSIVPFQLFAYFSGLFRFPASLKLSDLAATIFVSQRFCVWCAVSLVAFPAVLAGFFRTLTTRYSGRVILSIYLVPTLIVALVYRIEWGFSLHIICLYHAAVLFLWVSFLKNKRLLVLSVGLAAIAVEGLICVLSSNMRFLPVNGIHLNQVTGTGFLYLGGYLGLLAVILVAASLELHGFPPDNDQSVPAATGNRWLLVSGKLVAGLMIVALTIGIYSLYCLRFY